MADLLLAVLSVVCATWRSISIAVGVVVLFGSVSGISYNNFKDGEVFDYVVVGAGAAGSAVAARLALAGYYVILIEAGGEPGLLSKIPNAAMSLQGSKIDWYYKTIPNNKSCLSSIGQQCRFSGGRCLGGSTAINYMMYVRGSPFDYNLNITGWSWEDLQPYFLRYEGLRSSNRLPNSSHLYHNTSGLVNIAHFDKSANPWRQKILEGLMSLEFPYNPDVNAKSQIGVSEILGFVNKGERVTAATAYLNNDDVKRKLKIASNMKCTEVIIDENNVALGVSAMLGRSKRKLKVYAKHEVILSAGTVGTAHLLMLSGIGHYDHLQSFGIKVRANLPVGENLSDHVQPLIIVKVDQGLKSPLSLLGAIAVDAVQWSTSRSGPFASIGVSDIMGFANTNCYNFYTRKLENNDSVCELPNLQIIFAYIERYLLHIAPNIIMDIFGKEVVDQILDANSDSALLVVSPILLQPKSKGRIRLNSADSKVTPAITPNYLDLNGDVQEILKSVEIIEHLVQTPSFNQYNASILYLKLQNCPGSDQPSYWECYVRHMTSSVYHSVGTVALGTVLDERLRVLGIKKLRVGDLSVLPMIPRGNTAAVSIAIGERLADFLLEDRNKQDKKSDSYIQT